MNRNSVPNALFGLPGKPANGGSHPRFYDFDDGVTRLVKWHPSNHGPKACYNELVASRLGQLIGAPILRGGVVYVPADIIPPDHLAEGATAGFHFAVTKMEGENFVPTQHYDQIDNGSELPMAAVQLAWLAIGDHEGHNQYFQRLEIRRDGLVTSSKKIFRLVDMGAMFGTWGWTAASVTTLPPSYKLPSHLTARIKKVDLDNAIDELIAVDEFAIRDCFADCPAEWAVSEADKDAGAVRALAARQQLKATIATGNPTLQ